MLSKYYIYLLSCGRDLVPSQLPVIFKVLSIVKLPIIDHGAHGLFDILRVMWAHFQCFPVLLHSVGIYQP